MHTKTFKLFHLFSFHTQYINVVVCEDRRNHINMLCGKHRFRYCYDRCYVELSPGFKRLVGELEILRKIL